MVNVNPEMELIKGGAVTEAVQLEKESPKMPDEGNMPSGMDCAKKCPPGSC
jgi:hypothetical protein